MLKIEQILIPSVTVINQVYNAQITPAEYVMRGNAAILRCFIPSFVADFVHVVGWINDEGDEITNNEELKEGRLSL